MADDASREREQAATLRRRANDQRGEVAALVERFANLADRAEVEPAVN